VHRSNFQRIMELDREAREQQIQELEAAMGLLRVNQQGLEGEHFDGQIEEDEDDSHGGLRSAVQYGDDALFDILESEQREPSAASELVSMATGGANEMPDEDASVALTGDPGALIAYLEQMADTFEAQSGEEETEIRAKIATLRSVLEARSSVVRRQLQRLETSTGAAGEIAADSIVAESLEQIETNLGRVDNLLQDDPDAVAMLANSAHLWVPAVNLEGAGGAH